VCRLANALKARACKKGDRVIIYMSMGVEGVAAMQACARIGATHSVVFGGFSAQSLRDRIEDAGAVAGDHRRRAAARRQVPAAEGHRRRGAQPGRLRQHAPGHRLQAHRRQHRLVAGRDLWLDDLLAGQADHCEPEWVEAEHPLFLLYTSGSTGKPKGVQHSTGGYLLHAALTTKWTFDLKDRRRLLVHRRHRLGHRPHLHHLRPAGAGRHRDRVRGRAHLPGRRPLLEDDPGPQGQHLLHRAHGDPLADQGRRRQRRGAPAQATT
jgi:acyl-coenzyme A synthetase/AMP-(fatty) acid ligase